MILDFRRLLWLPFFLVPISFGDSFVDNFVVIKWIGVYLWVLLATVNGFWSTTHSEKNLPQQFTLVSVLLVLVRAILLCCFRNYSIEWFSFFDAITFVWICYICFKALTIPMGDCSKSRAFDKLIQFVEWPLYVGLCFVLGRAITHFAMARFIESSFLTSAFASSFGNINMLAEYLLVLLPILIFLSKSQNSNAKSRWFAIGLLWVSLFFIYWGQSRSAWIGTAFVFLGSLLTKFSEKTHLKVVACVAAVTLGLHLVWSNGQLERIVEEKKASDTARRSLVESSLALMAEKPWGIGSDLFEFYIAPYRVTTDDPQNERVLDKTPHNELLRWGIEHGWLYLFIAISSLLLILYRTYVHSNKVYFLIVLAFIPQIIFQFPFQNAFPFVYAALMLGCFMAEVEKEELSWSIMNYFKKAKIFSKRSAYQLFTMIYLLLAIPTFCLFTWSKFAAVHYMQNLELSKIACDIYPVNWRSCVAVIQNYFNRGQTTEALTQIKAELDRHPFNLLALKFEILSHLKMNHQKQACETADLYETLLNHRGQFSSLVGTTCGEDIRFKGLSGIALEKEYLEWRSESHIVQ